MAYYYSTKEILKLLSSAGFKHVKGNGGSHQRYVNENAPIVFPEVPVHANGISNGTGDTIIHCVVLICKILDINICTKSKGISENVKKSIRQIHSMAKKNPVFLIPEDQRKILKIDKPSKALEFMEKLIKEYRIKNKEADANANENDTLQR